MNKDFKMYIGKRVWCKTKELAEDFLQLAHENGWKWMTGDSLLDRTYWEVCEKDTCYFVRKDNKITFETIKKHTPYYINEFVEYEPLCADKDVSPEETKAENKMNKRQIVKEYWSINGSIGDAIQNFLDNNLDYKLVNYQTGFSETLYALVLYELR